MGTVALLAALLPATAALAQGLEPFSRQRLQSLHIRPRTVVVHVSAPGCVPCERQARALEDVARGPGPLPPVFLAADAARDEAFLREHGSPPPGALLVFREGLLVDRSIGPATGAQVRRFLREAMARARFDPRRRPKRALGPKR